MSFQKYAGLCSFRKKSIFRAKYISTQYILIKPMRIGNVEKIILLWWSKHANLMWRGWEWLSRGFGSRNRKIMTRGSDANKRLVGWWYQHVCMWGLKIFFACINSAQNYCNTKHELTWVEDREKVLFATKKSSSISRTLELIRLLNFEFYHSSSDSFIAKHFNFYSDTRWRLLACSR